MIAKLLINNAEKAPGPIRRALLKYGCSIGLHYSGTTDGGGMGDCWTCDWCGKDKYPEVFPGTILRQRSLSDPEPEILKAVRQKESK